MYMIYLTFDFVYVWMYVYMHACVCVCMEVSALRGQKRVLDPLELEL